MNEVKGAAVPDTDGEREGVGEKDGVLDGDAPHVSDAVPLGVDDGVVDGESVPKKIDFVGDAVGDDERDGLVDGVAPTESVGEGDGDAHTIDLIVCDPESAMKTIPALDTATPFGLQRVATERALPSMTPEAPVPASVVTTDVASSMRLIL